jgi:hypothetical protein
MSDHPMSKHEPKDSAADIAVGSMNSMDSDWTPEEETAVRRKFDFTITPLVTLLYMLCAIDRYLLHPFPSSHHNVLTALLTKHNNRANIG